ncbi:hypothetical protein GWO43_16115 [candidate division KSB1 bacterium]|nr:hypothetical protein [candidate division KSB1 bacterium]NIV68759.1 hypothetical protein [Phycisphaerae bacterium]NIS25476.1 hypothetical protein [candidate division KSB1 bacterium]NIT72369.1 hypothetical protein [candidate division KSB1 bacterium]NIU26153.1 hypothetical protein [candidate division KSB1 bacterium]
MKWKKIGNKCPFKPFEKYLVSDGERVAIVSAHEHECFGFDVEDCPKWMWIKYDDDIIAPDFYDENKPEHHGVWGFDDELSDYDEMYGKDQIDFIPKYWAEWPPPAPKE